VAFEYAVDTANVDTIIVANIHPIAPLPTPKSRILALVSELPNTKSRNSTLASALLLREDEIIEASALGNGKQANDTQNG
jgi:hypothetical protein